MLVFVVVMINTFVLTIDTSHPVDSLPPPVSYQQLFLNLFSSTISNGVDIEVHTDYESDNARENLLSKSPCWNHKYFL